MIINYEFNLFLKLFIHETLIIFQMHRKREYVCINNLHLNALVLVPEIDRCNTLGSHDAHDPRWILRRPDNPDPIVGSPSIVPRIT